MILKVKRTEAAKEFPLLKKSKPGDVGYNLPILLPYVEDWQKLYEDYIVQCKEMDEQPDMAYLNELLHGYIVIEPQEEHLFATGLFVEFGEDYWGKIEPRSSAFKQRLITNGQIDTGYRGELFVRLANIGTKPFIVHHGDMHAQLIVQKNYTKDFEVVEVVELSPSERGADGFGSTGTSAVRR